MAALTQNSVTLISAEDECVAWSHDSFVVAVDVSGNVRFVRMNEAVLM